MSIKLLQATPDFTILIHTTPSIANERQLSRNRPGEVIPSFLNEKLLLDHYSALQKYEFTNTVKKKNNIKSIRYVIGFYYQWRRYQRSNGDTMSRYPQPHC